MEIKNRVMIITGASSGIGAATARALAQLGAIVVLAARRAVELEALAREIAGAGGQALAIPADVSARADIDRVVRLTLERYGRIDVLINNAGIGAGSSVINSDDHDMQRIVDVNLLAPARCVQAVLPAMCRQGGGMIVNIGSISGEVATNGLYAATKFGLRGLSDALRRELRHDNINVVLVVPGFIRTAMTVDVTAPMPGPEAVARAITSAIRRPRRRVIVPWPYGPLMYLAKLFPSLTDRLFGSRAFQRRSQERETTM